MDFTEDRPLNLKFREPLNYFRFNSILLGFVNQPYRLASHRHAPLANPDDLHPHVARLPLLLRGHRRHIPG
jgi:hypothetical protein